MWLILPRQPAPERSAASSVAVAREGPPDVSHLAPRDAQLALANWNYDRQNWTHAIEHYQQAISLGCDNADLRTDLGNCYRFTAEPTNALEQYRIAQRQDPRHEKSLFNTAGLYGDVLHDAIKAAELWREYLRRFPESVDAARARQFLAEFEQQDTEQTAALKRLISDDFARQPR